MQTAKKRERIWYWDILRIAAVVCLVVRHVSTASFEFVEPLGSKWWGMNCYGSLVAWMVPVYMMLSGASFLDPARELPIKRIYLRNIVRMLIAFFAWSLIYAVYNLIAKQAGDTTFEVMFFQGHFHLWFLPMIIGVYMLTPLLRLATVTMKGAMYAFAVSAVIGVVLPMVQDLGWFMDEELIGWTNGLGMFSAHVCFYYAGYLFHKLELKKWQRYVLYAAAIIATALVFFGTAWLTIRDQYHNEDMQSDSNVLTALQGVSLFVLAKYTCRGKKFKPATQHALQLYSSLTFGVYLVHVIFIAFLDRIGFSPVTYNAGWMIPLMLALVVPLSFGTTYLIRRIPVVGQYIT